MIQIYKIVFDDGAAYVGQTSRLIPIRIKAHSNWSSACNSQLFARLNRGDRHDIQVLSRHQSKRVADEAERSEISKLEKPLNRFGIREERFQSDESNPSPPKNARGRKNRRYAQRYYPDRRPGNYRCRVCYQLKRDYEYHSDGSRSCGLSSVCKNCDRLRQSAASKAMKNNESTSEAYYKTIEAIRKKQASPHER